MNISNLFGTLCALTVLGFAVATSSKTPKVFLDPHGILVVIGGTMSAAFLCFPLKTFVRVGKAFAKKFIGNYLAHYETVINELVDLSKGSRDDPEYFQKKIKTIKTPFLKDALDLLVQGGISEDALDDILSKRAETYTKRYEHDVLVFKTVAKFPPAFGLLGTTLGMIALLQNLGGKDAQKMLGSAMAVGLVATFYGIVLANLMFIPISENLASLNKDDEVVREIVIDGLRLIRQKEHPKVVEEFLKSYLLPHERINLKGAKKAK